jgi:preprotein translocase subunit SecD
MVARKSKAKPKKRVEARLVAPAPAAAKPAARLALTLRTVALPVMLFLIGILVIVPILSLARLIRGIAPLLLLAGALVALVLVAYFSMRRIYRGILTE